MTEFDIDNMRCGHCASTITKTVRSLDPDAKVEVDLGQKLRVLPRADHQGPRLAPRLDWRQASLWNAWPLRRYLLQHKRKACAARLLACRAQACS